MGPQMGGTLYSYAFKMNEQTSAMEKHLTKRERWRIKTLAHDEEAIMIPLYMQR